MENLHYKRLDRNTREKIYIEAADALLTLQIGEGLAKMQTLSYACPKSSTALQLDTIQSDYKSMLHFIRQGGTDPQRTAMQKRIATHALELLDDIHKNIRVAENEDEFAKMYNRLYGSMYDGREETTYVQPSAAQAVEGSEWGEDVFILLWTLPRIARQDLDELLINFELMEPKLRCLALSAFFLSLWEYFDPNKLKVLIRFMKSTHVEVRARATMGYVLTHLRYARRIALYEDDSLFVPSTPQTDKEICMVQHFLHVQKNCMEIHNQINNRLQAYKDRSNTPTDTNGYLESILEDRYDLNPTTFVTIYNKPFFQELPIWWRPFHMEDRDIQDTLRQQKDSDLAKIMKVLKAHCCDVDMHAVILLMQINAGKIKLSNIGYIMTGEENEEVNQPRTDTPWIAYSRIAQNLFRFFRFSKWKDAYPDPFHLGVYLPGNKTFARHFNTKRLHKLYKLFMRTSAYNTALQCVQDIIAREGSNAELLMACGECHQELDNPLLALQFYKQAELLADADAGLLKKMAACYRKLDYHREALDCMERLTALPGVSREEYLPDMADCQLRIAAPDQALQIYFEMKYLHPESLDATKGIMQCTFLLKQYQKAQHYSQEYLNQKPSPDKDDFLLAGHIEWLCGSWKNAMDRYSRSLACFLEENKERQVGDWDLLTKDKDLLLAHGIPVTDVMLMKDLVLHTE